MQNTDRRLQITAMAFTRDRWISKFANTFKGALDEYAKLRYAEAIGMDDYWSDEVRALMKTVDNLFNPAMIRTKTRFNLYKAAAEAFMEAMNEQKQVLDAKNDFLKTYLDTREERLRFQETVRELDLASEDLAFDILERFLPKHQEKILVEVQKSL
jgi:hypothetical protein